MPFPVQQDTSVFQNMFGKIVRKQSDREVNMRHVIMANVEPVQATVMEADLEEALQFAGAGKYQFLHCILMLATLLAAILEMIGVAFILPAAACDLDVPDSLKGILTSLPNIGVILTAPFWGRAADNLGRKPVLLGSLAVSGAMAFIAAFMPNLVSFAVFKFACSLFLSCPSSLGYAYTSEMLPRHRRDTAVLITNGLINVLTVFSPGLAWLILSYDWQYDWGAIDMRPWRLLTAVYSLPLLITAVLMFTADESPKFLMTRGKEQEALEVVRRIYSVNSGMPEDTFCVKFLKSPHETGSERSGSGCELTSPPQHSSALSLLMPPHLKWFALTGVLMFGVFSFLNGLFLFAPDTINKVMSHPSSTGTVCELILSHDNSTLAGECVDAMSHQTFYIMVVTTLVYGVLVTAASMSPLSKKTLLVAMFIVVGIGCLIAGLTTNRIVAGIAMSSLQITALGIGPLTAYVVHLFPTSLRGTAVGAVLMLGRVGSVVGANAAGVSLNAACMVTFYAFALLVFICAALSFLLPPDHVSKNDSVSES
ncbi:putative transporter svop-1 [Anticarsia gemmatalis]|uniref:putative transporter svop-1 n=1 Tax=Anticarsia gemmatalis TaxID=129554 RepID=UPI003F767F10